LLDKSTLEILEYDLNVFYRDLGTLSEITGDYDYAEVYTIQPSIYYVVKGTNASSRIYLTSWDLTLEETRMIAPDFPEDDYGDDFFIGLEYFLDQCKTLPKTVKDMLDTLPKLETIELDPDGPELSW